MTYSICLVVRKGHEANKQQYLGDFKYSEVPTPVYSETNEKRLCHFGGLSFYSPAHGHLSVVAELGECNLTICFIDGQGTEIMRFDTMRVETRRSEFVQEIPGSPSLYATDNSEWFLNELARRAYLCMKNESAFA